MVNHDIAVEHDRLLEAVRAAQRSSSVGLRGRATTEAEMDKLNQLHAEEVKPAARWKCLTVRTGLGRKPGESRVEEGIASEVLTNQRRV